MANIELHKSFLGDRVVGHVDPPGLSWSDHRALADSARASHSIALETNAIRQRLHDSQTALAGLDRYGVTSAPAWLEHIAWEGARTAAVVRDWWERQLELAAVHYDRAVYLASTDMRESALELEDAGAIDPRSYALALADKLLAEHPQLVDLAAEKLKSAVAEQKATIEADLRRVQQVVKRIADLAPNPQRSSWPASCTAISPKHRPRRRSTIPRGCGSTAWSSTTSSVPWRGSKQMKSSTCRASSKRTLKH